MLFQQPELIQRVILEVDTQGGLLEEVMFELKPKRCEGAPWEVPEKGKVGARARGRRRGGPCGLPMGSWGLPEGDPGL